MTDNKTYYRGCTRHRDFDQFYAYVDVIQNHESIGIITLPGFFLDKESALAAAEKEAVRLQAMPGKPYRNMTGWKRWEE